MNETVFQPKKNLGGIPANRVMVPLILILVILHVIIIGLIVNISSRSSELSDTMRRSSLYIEDATSLLAGSSLMSESSANFVLLPVTANGELNFSPLAAYAGELAVDRRGNQVMEKFQHYDVSQEAKETLAVAADAANQMMDTQLHAIALVTSVYPLPDVQPVNTIPIPALPAEEESWPAEQKLSTAESLILSSEYGQNKQAVSVNVNACVGMIKEEMGRQAAENGQRVSSLHATLRVVTGAIILLQIVIFTGLYRLLIRPLGSSVRLITEDRPLDEGKGLREMRLLAFAYNGLLRRRDALEGILRSAASTDALTNLRNRYGYEQYVLDMSEGPVGVILFDVNFLKRTNDTEGHAAGDRLLKSSADCISVCFGNQERNNCFRFGGDEFVAVVKGVSAAELDQMIQRFREDQRGRGISVSWGSACTDAIENTTIKALMDLADKELYQCKETMHAKDATYASTHNLA